MSRSGCLRCSRQRQRQDLLPISHRSGRLWISGKTYSRARRANRYVPVILYFAGRRRVLELRALSLPVFCAISTLLQYISIVCIRPAMFPSRGLVLRCVLCPFRTRVSHHAERTKSETVNEHDPARSAHHLLSIGARSAIAQSVRPARSPAAHVTCTHDARRAIRTRPRTTRGCVPITDRPPPARSGSAGQTRDIATPPSPECESGRLRRTAHAR
ncbi:hypothetical protein OH77DRAFT_1429666 [Trametes cingulata]|nr:hypothetical protein OH77DRAFT_1429666 [Trametes cingulata]